MKIKEKMKTLVNPLWLQIAGISLIIVAYILFGLNYQYLGWFAVLLPVGILELVLIWGWNITITSFARRLLPKKIDYIIMLGLVVITWWWFGPNAAGLYFIGLLSNHFGEAQPK